VLTILYVVEIFTHMLRLWIYLMMYLWCLWHGDLKMYAIYPLRRFSENFMHVIWDILKMWRLFL